MIPVLGLPLSAAEERLIREGLIVEKREVRSKKGLEGDDFRVIAAKPLDGRRVLIEYACFLTNVLNK